MKSTWEKLAAGEDLPASVAWDVWRSGDEAARRKLAAARELPRDIEEEIAAGTDATLLEAWLGRRRERRLLTMVDETLGPEMRAAFARQAHLDEPTRRRLAAFGEERVLLTLLGRSDLGMDEHDDYLAGYVCSQELRRDSYGANLLTLIGEHETTWLKLLERIGPKQAPLLADACAMVGREAVHKLGHHTLLRLADEAPEVELARAAGNLIRGCWLSPGDYLEMAKHPRLGRVAFELQQRATVDTPLMLGELQRCAAGPLAPCAATRHAGMLEMLAPMAEKLTLPWATLARSSARHNREIAATQRTIFYRRMTSEEAGEMTRGLVNLGRHDEAAELIDVIDRRFAELVPPVRAALARRGSRHSLDGEIGEEDVLLLLENYQPIGDLLDDPVLAGKIAKEVSGLGQDERETFYKLAGDWAGNLHGLLAAARSL